MATELDLSTTLFAGALVFIALENTGTSDAATKPAAENAAWKELCCVESWAHRQVNHEEERDCPDPDTGWRTGKEVYTLGDRFEVTTRRTTGLYQRLQYGVENALAAGVAQTPFVVADRMVRAWIKVQLRQHIGTDRFVLDCWCEVRVLGDPPAATKAVQKPNLEFYALKSTLNAFNIPA